MSEKCGVCSVPVTSECVLYSHLMGKAHQAKARADQRPVTAEQRQRQVVATATPSLTKYDIAFVFNAFAKHGKVIDFRFNLTKEKKLKSKSRIFVEFASSVSAADVLGRSRAGGFLIGGQQVTLRSASDNGCGQNAAPQPQPQQQPQPPQPQQPQQQLPPPQPPQPQQPPKPQPQQPHPQPPQPQQPPKPAPQPPKPPPQQPHPQPPQPQQPPKPPPQQPHPQPPQPQQPPKPAPQPAPSPQTDQAKKQKQKQDQNQNQKQKQKPPPEPDPINHPALLAMLSHLESQGRPADELMQWLADRLLLTPAEHQNRIRLCRDIQGLLRSRFRTCLVQAFGSSVSGLGFHGCDVDLYAFIDPLSPGSGLPPDADDAKKVRVVARALEACPLLCRRVIRIPQARVPIVKFRAVPLGGVECDMSFKDPMSCQNSRLIGWLMEADSRARLVTVSVRYWAKRRSLAGGEHHPAKMSSYCITLLVVTFLQQLQPPVLPPVAWCQANVPEMLIGPWNAAFHREAAWQSENSDSPSQLLLQFFRFCSGLEAASSAVVPLAGRVLPRDLLRDRSAAAGRPELAHLPAAAWTRYWDVVSGGQAAPLDLSLPLLLQDPFELSFNVARNYRAEGWERFRRCCEQAARMPFARLFEAEKMPKLKLTPTPKKPAAAGAAAQAAVAAVAAAARAAAAATATTPPGETRKRGREASADSSASAAGRSDSKVGRLEGGGEDAERGRRSSREDAGDRAAGKEGSALTNGAASTPPNGTAAAAVQSRLLQRALSDFGEPPSWVIPLPLPCGRQSCSPEEVRQLAEAAAAFLAELFRAVLRLDCETVSFAELDCGLDVVRGYHCAARHPFWECRKVAAKKLVGRGRGLEFESEVTRLALELQEKEKEKERKEKKPRAGGPIAAFTAYLVTEGGQLRLCYYHGAAETAGRNCMPFLASFIPDMCRRVEYGRLFARR